MRFRVRLVFLTLVACLFVAACSEQEASREVLPEPVTRETDPPAEAEWVVRETVEETVAPPVQPPPTAQRPAEEAFGANHAEVDWSDSEQVSDLIAELETEGGQNSIDALGLILERSDDPMTKLEVLDAIAFMAEEGDVSVELERALADPLPEIRMEAVDVAAELALFDLLPALRAQQYGETDAEVREALEDAIFELEEEEREQRQ